MAHAVGLPPSEPLPGAPDKTEVMATLKARVAAITVADEQEEPARRAAVTFGVAAVDGHLPDGGLAPDGVHEVAAVAYGDLPSAIGFCAGLAVRFMGAVGRGSVVWCTRAGAAFDFGAVYGPGLAAFGLDPARLLMVEAGHARDLLWTLEQAARLRGLAAVIGNAGPTEAYDLTASRRLQLAARDVCVPVVVLRGHGDAAGGASAALTRWRIAAAPAPGDHVGAPAWTVGLERARGVAPARWLLAWDPASASFAVPAPEKAREQPVLPARPVAGGRLRAAG
jgi:protein ImuA